MESLFVKTNLNKNKLTLIIGFVALGHILGYNGVKRDSG